MPHGMRMHFLRQVAAPGHPLKDPLQAMNGQPMGGSLRHPESGIRILALGKIPGEPNPGFGPALDFAFLVSLAHHDDPAPLPIHIPAVQPYGFAPPAPGGKEKLDHRVFPGGATSVAEPFQLVHGQGLRYPVAQFRLF